MQWKRTLVLCAREAIDEMAWLNTGTGNTSKTSGRVAQLLVVPIRRIGMISWMDD